jgi:hypothetical protein
LHKDQSILLGHDDETTLRERMSLKKRINITKISSKRLVTIVLSLKLSGLSIIMDLNSNRT